MFDICRAPAGFLNFSELWELRLCLCPLEFPNVNYALEMQNHFLFALILTFPLYDDFTNVAEDRLAILL